MSRLPRANKDLGQHFLKEKKIINAITKDWAHQAQAIIEIGPGPGILSESLSQHPCPYFVIEKDTRFQDYLRSYVKEEHLFFMDALKFDWKYFFEHYKLEDKKVWLVSNLPYNISAPLLINFIQQLPITFMTLMFQKEVAEKSIMDNQKKNATNSLGVLSHSYFNVKKLMEAKPGSFEPPPKVNSLVLSYQRRQKPLIALEEFDAFESFLRRLFSQRRKKIGPLLKQFYPTADYNSHTELLNLRSEALSLEQVINLYLCSKS